MSTSRPGSSLTCPFMLEDLAINCRRMSASLPPDDWDPNLPAIQLRRVGSGFLVPSIHSASPPTPTIEVARPRPSADINGRRTRDLRDEERGLLTKMRDNINTDEAQNGLHEEGKRRHQKRKRWWRLMCCWPYHRRSRGEPETITATCSKSIFERIKKGIKHLWPFRKGPSRPHNVWWRRKGRNASGSERLL
ncbi:hypothetical protein P280DRAFT_523701 [Massarina eburnea CBS 473.64]|uniref:Uncharacterized protein n=1 Tax=Massarina eburnea CBS 473.64 TaxID=1395130 RepID=A0A6A6RI62_9PLEO|nr:hypothetical protein P280DRAFT_523701 [Massarina eburnea CBS 473.64]